MERTMTAVTAAPKLDDRSRAHHRVAVIGTGFAGLGAAIRMRQAGITDFVVFERAEEVGGTWRDNTYPGAACDVPSHLYSFSFAPNPGWTESFSAQPEIQAYLQDCADRFGVRPHVRFRHTVEAIVWDDAAQHWRIDTDRGSWTAAVVINGMGALSEPSIPDLPGLDRFQGAMFHSARWDHDHDLTGKRVAVVGTGASAIQFVPQIVDQVAQLDLYQRTPPWIIPRRNRRIRGWERRLYRRFPRLQQLVRAAIYWGRELYVLGFRGPERFMKIPEKIARRLLAEQVPDPALRATLTPDYTIGCKRILIASDYYPALSRPHVDVIPCGVGEVREHAVVGADGVERPADTIIFGTGFHVTDYPAGKLIRGRDGRRLTDVWADGMESYVGATVAGFPNLFLMTGPNTGLGHTSMVYMIEAQLDYIIDCLQRMDRHGIATVEVRPEVQRAYNVRVQERLEGTVWTTGGCSSWYLDDTGRNTTLWPDYTFRYRRRTRRFDPRDYVLRRAGDAAADAPQVGTAGDRVA
jgi:cation diffusion facilitator CzcD-associated flavoprotein CzcO